MFERNHGRAVWCVLLILSAVFFCGCRTEDPADQESGRGSLSPVQRITVGVGRDGYVRKGKKAAVGFYPLNAGICETLVRLDEAFRVHPLLAERWEYVAENTWRFHLRRGIRFHDGQAFTAEAVKYSLERIAKTGGGVIKAAPGCVRIIDDYTVEIVPKVKNLRLVEQLTHTSNSILSPGTDPGRQPVGTGPFRFESYRPDEFISVVRFPGYWGKEALLERILFRFIPDDQTRVIALEAGELDMVFKMPEQGIRTVAKKEGLHLLTSEIGQFTALHCNMKGAFPFDLLSRREIRRAVAFAIDAKSIIRTLRPETGRYSPTLTPPAILGADRDRIAGPPFDPGKSAEILDSLGWEIGEDGVRKREGRRLLMTLVSGFPSAADHRPVPEVIQAQLKRVGIEATIVEVEDTGVYEQMLARGEGDLFLERGSQNNADPTFLPYLLHHPAGIYGNLNGPWFSLAGEFEELLDRARNTPDMALCRELSARAVHVLVDREAAAIPIAAHFRVAGVREGIKGMALLPSAVNQRGWNHVYVE